MVSPLHARRSTCLEGENKAQESGSDENARGNEDGRIVVAGVDTYNGCHQTTNTIRSRCQARASSSMDGRKHFRSVTV